MKNKSEFITDEKKQFAVFVVDVGDVIIPEDVLRRFKLLRHEEGGKKWICDSVIYPYIKVYVVENFGSKKNPSYGVVAIHDMFGNVQTISDEGQARQLFSRIRKFDELWKHAVSTVSLPLRPKDLKIVVTDNDVRSDYGVILSVRRERSYFGKKDYWLARIGSLPDELKPELVSILSKHGFEEGIYGGYIRYTEPDVSELLNEVKDYLERNKDKIIDWRYSRQLSEYNSIATKISEARRKLGLPTQPNTPVNVADVLNLIKGKGKQEVKMGEPKAKAVKVEGEDEDKMFELSLDFTPKELTPPSGPTVNIDELRKEIYEEVRKNLEDKMKELEREIENYKKKLEAFDPETALMSKGFKKFRVVVFDLPTEYKGAKTEYTKDEKGNVVEKKTFAVDPAIYRTLRRKFYDILNSLSFRTKLGWVLMTDDENELKDLYNVMESLNKLSGEERSVEIIETWIPVKWVVDEAVDYTANLSERLDELALKLTDSSISASVKKRIEREKEQIERTLDRLNKIIKDLS